MNPILITSTLVVPVDEPIQNPIQATSEYEKSPIKDYLFESECEKSPIKDYIWETFIEHKEDSWEDFSKLRRPHRRYVTLKNLHRLV